MADFARNKLVILPGTIEDAGVYKDIRRALQELGYAKVAPDPQILTRKWNFFSNNMQPYCCDPLQ